jgi:hypothetical protein
MMSRKHESYCIQYREIMFDEITQIGRMKGTNAFYLLVMTRHINVS